MRFFCSPGGRRPQPVRSARDHLGARHVGGRVASASAWAGRPRPEPMRLRQRGLERRRLGHLHVRLPVADSRHDPHEPEQATERPTVDSGAPLRRSGGTSASLVSNSRSQRSSASSTGSVNVTSSWWALSSTAACRPRRAVRARPPRRWRCPSSRTPRPARTGVPALVGHLAAARVQPGDVLDVGAADGSALEEPAAPERRVLVADANEPAREVQERLARRASGPSRVQLISLSWQ